MNRLFSITLSAVKDPGGEHPEVAIQNAILLVVDEHRSMDNILIEQAKKVYPGDEGWVGHEGVYTEIYNEMVIDDFRITWQADKIGN